MKILKYILLFIALFLIGSYFWVNAQPDSYNVKQTKLIKAPASLIFNNINDFKNWKQWGPWHDEDDTIKETYPEQTSDVGGSYSWTSEKGSGNMKTIAVEKNKSITQKLQFGDFTPTDVYWTFEEVENGTNVTWGMKNDTAPFMFKIMVAMAGSWEKIFEPMLNSGLNKLDKVIQETLIKNPPKPKVNYHATDIVEKNLPKQYFIGYFIKGKISEMTQDFQTYMPKAGMYMGQNNLIGKATPGAVYIKWDMENNAAEYYIGLFTQDDVTPKAEMKKVTIPEGKAIMVSKFGAYGEGDMDVHMDIEKYMKSNNLKMGKYVWEKYMNDPTTVKPIEVQTDIYYAVK